VSSADQAGASVGVLRSVRAAVVGLSASGLALLGHVAAGGAAPPAGQLTLAVLAVLVVSRALSVRRWTVGPLLAVLLGSQALFHVAFSGAGPAMHVHGGQHLASGSSMPGHSGLPMLVGHSVAALVTASCGAVRPSLARGARLCRRAGRCCPRPGDLPVGRAAGAAAAARVCGRAARAARARDRLTLPSPQRPRTQASPPSARTGAVERPSSTCRVSGSLLGLLAP
jgi:hypothetical protein